MSVSKALENSARAFCIKYSCNFDFVTFESRVEEFTFLRPNGGWIDVYKAVFDLMYKKSLEKAAVGAVDSLDGEAMLDDFEYTLIRPYVKENEPEIKHKPYVGMYDRVTRLMYLDKLTKQAPSNPVDLYAEKYKSGEITAKQMLERAKAVIKFTEADREHYIEAVGYVMALEGINCSRSLAWRVFHPFKNRSEKKTAELIKSMLVEKFEGGINEYEEIAADARKVFKGRLSVNASLDMSIARAREELDRKIKMNEALKGSRALDSSDNMSGIA